MIKKWGVFVLMLLLLLTACEKKNDPQVSNQIYEELSFGSLLPKGEVKEIIFTPDHSSTSIRDTKIINKIMEKWNDVILKYAKVTPYTDGLMGPYYNIDITVEDENDGGKVKTIGITYLSGTSDRIEIIFYDSENNRYKMESEWSKSFSEFFRACKEVCPIDEENGKW